MTLRKKVATIADQVATSSELFQKECDLAGLAMPIQEEHDK